MWIRKGESRTVVRIGPFVFKFGLSRKGMACNIAEHSLWNRVKKTHIYYYFVPTLKGYGILNIMPYAGPTVFDSGRKVEQEMKDLANVVGIYDPNPYNIAANYEGGQAFLDYGYTNMIDNLL